MKNTKLPSIVAILILTLITTVMWVSFNIIRAVTTKPTPIVPEEVSMPLDPNLNQKTISLIKEKVYIDDGSIPNVISVENTVSVETPVPIATPVATTSPSPTTPVPTAAVVFTPTPTDSGEAPEE